METLVLDHPNTVKMLLLEAFVAKPLWLVRRNAESFSTLLFISLEGSFAPMNVTITLECEDVRGQAVQEPTVVADDNNATREIQDGFF